MLIVVTPPLLAPGRRDARDRASLPRVDPVAFAHYLGAGQQLVKVGLGWPLHRLVRCLLSFAACDLLQADELAVDHVPRYAFWGSVPPAVCATSNTDQEV